MSDYTRQWVDEQIVKADANRKAGITAVPRMMRMSYGPGETGWGIDLGGGHAIIDNVPLEDGLGLFDIVELKEDDDGWKAAGAVVWRYWSKKSGLRYGSEVSSYLLPHTLVFEGREGDASDQRLYSRIAEALVNTGSSLESMVAGMAMISHNEDDDISAVLVAAGIDSASFKVEAL